MHVPAAWMNMKIGPTQHPFRLPHLSLQSCTWRLLIKYISKLTTCPICKQKRAFHLRKNQTLTQSVHKVSSTAHRPLAWAEPNSCESCPLKIHILKF